MSEKGSGSKSNKWIVIGVVVGILLLVGVVNSALDKSRGTVDASEPSRSTPTSGARRSRTR